MILMYITVGLSTNIHATNIAALYGVTQNHRHDRNEHYFTSNVE